MSAIVPPLIPGMISATPMSAPRQRIPVFEMGFFIRYVCRERLVL